MNKDKELFEDVSEGDVIPQADDAMTGRGSGNGAEQVGRVSQNITESYIFASGRRDLSVYSERLLLSLVKTAQKQIYGVDLSDPANRRQLSIGNLGEVQVEIAAKELLGSDHDTNYTDAKEAVLELMSKKIEHERPLIRKGKNILGPDGKQIYEYEAHTLLNDVYINLKPGTIIVNVNKKTWEEILDMSRGYKSYDMYVAQRLSRTCSIRMYKLICNQRTPLKYKISDLRAMWRMENKNKATKDFIKNTLKSAKEELDRMSPWTFEYETVCAENADVNKGRRGRKSITSVIIKPVHRIAFDSDTKALAPLSPSIALTRPVTNRLVRNFGFSQREIKNNLVLFVTAAKHFDLEEFLINLTPTVSRARNPQGYVVNAVKNHLKEKHGIVIKKDKIMSTKPDTGRKTTRVAPSRAQMKTPRTKPVEGSVGATLGKLFGDIDANLQQ